MSRSRIFGCTAYALVPKCKRSKWDPKFKEYLFTGYCNKSKRYRLIDPCNRNTIKSRDVFFDENSLNGNTKEKSNESLGQHFLEIEFLMSPAHISQPGDQEKDEEGSTAEKFKEDLSTPDSLTSSAEVHPKCELPQRLWKSSQCFEDYVISIAMSIDSSEDPTTLEDALSRPDSENWKMAVKEE